MTLSPKPVLSLLRNKHLEVVNNTKIQILELFTKVVCKDPPTNNLMIRLKSRKKFLLDSLENLILAFYHWLSFLIGKFE